MTIDLLRLYLFKIFVVDRKAKKMGVPQARNAWDVIFKNIFFNYLNF